MTMIDLFEPTPVPDEVFQGQFTTKEKALITARKLGSLGGGVVSVQDKTNESPSTPPTGEGLFIINFANGQSINADLAAFKLANNPNLAAFDVGAPKTPIGVAHECDEREYYAIREKLAVSGVRELMPQGGGVAGKGALDTELTTADKLGYPPFAAGGPLPKCNYVIQIQGRTIVNAAFIGHMIDNYGPQGAGAFAVTRRWAV